MHYAKEWEEEYSDIRHQIFQMKYSVKKMLSLNCTTQKCKHEIVQADKHEERKEFDREIERSDIFKNLKEIRTQNSLLKKQFQDQDDIQSKLESEEISNKDKEMLRKKLQLLLRNKEKYSTALNGLVNSFKQNQIQIFEELADDECNLLQELDQFQSKLAIIEAKSQDLHNEYVDQYQQINMHAELKQVDEEEEEKEQKEELKQEGYEEHYDDPYIQDQFKDSLETTPKKRLNSQQGFRIKQTPSQMNLPQEESKQQQQMNIIQQWEQQLLDNKKEVQKLDKLIEENGGKNCGWKAQDHSDFIVLSVKYKGQFNSASFWEDYQSGMGYFSDEELHNHVEKYVKYLQWEEQKKMLMVEYKEIKYKINQRQEEEKDVEKKKLQQKRQLSLHKKKEVREIVQEKIAKWKETKELREQFDEEKSYLEFKKQQKLKEEKTKQRILNQKLNVLDFQEAKINKKKLEEKRILQQKMENRVVLSPKTKQRLKSNQEQLFQKQMTKIYSKKYQKEDEELRKQELMEMKNPKYQKVESKLLAQTSATENKQTSKYDFNHDRFSQAGQNFAGHGVRMTGKKLQKY